MAEVVETHDLTAASQHGWAVDYRIRRDDGEELHAEVRCWDKAQTAAERAANAEALAAIADRGSTAALEYAELVESPATRGAVLISMWFDPADEGKLRRVVSYERSLEQVAPPSDATITALFGCDSLLLAGTAHTYPGCGWRVAGLGRRPATTKDDRTVAAAITAANA